MMLGCGARNARIDNAARLARAAGNAAGVALVSPVEINMLFVRLPDPPCGMDAGPFRYYKLGTEQRLVCRHDQEEAGMDAGRRRSSRRWDESPATPSRIRPVRRCALVWGRLACDSSPRRGNSKSSHCSSGWRRS